jgi:SAM-dependent methyltransferase
MNLSDEVALANQALWEAEVEKGCGFTIPWLDLDVALLRRYANGELESLPDPLTGLGPPGIFANIAGKDVLCLASGGGQQSAVFSLLGARVTVVDLTEGQLRGDQEAAAHYGYEVITLQADMRDLGALDADTFDLVYQADSIAYVPDVREVYREVARVLRPGGLYRVKHYQPAIHFVEWQPRMARDSGGYRITKPYAERIDRRDDGGIEFRHYMDDIFNGLLDAGLSLQHVVDWGRHNQPSAEAPPGSWAHQDPYIGGGFIIVARKE